jgi:hypothetical protein
LPELDECWTQILQRSPQPRPEVGRQKLLKAFLGRAVASQVEDVAETVAYKDAADLGEPSQVPRADGRNRHDECPRKLETGRYLSIGGGRWNWTLGHAAGTTSGWGLWRGLVFEHPYPVL